MNMNSKLKYPFSFFNPIDWVPHSLPEPISQGCLVKNDHSRSQTRNRTYNIPFDVSEFEKSKIFARQRVLAKLWPLKIIYPKK